MVGTISDWIISLKKEGLEDFAERYHTEKSIDDKRLIDSGLPAFDRMKIGYHEFTEENVGEFLSEYERFIVRALPAKGRSDLPRRPKIGVKTYEECKKFLNELFSGELKGEEDNYNVSLVEIAENKGSGIIISRSNDVLIEIGSCGLMELSHGADPDLSCRIDLAGIGHITDKMCWGKGKDEKTVRSVLKYIELTRDNFSPLFMRGYFEFVITNKNDIKFWDYKVNDMYLK
ncbi:MAG: hypothetical protein V3V78_03125 [Candidatus Woesearchaeota archaeon]